MPWIIVLNSYECPSAFYDDGIWYCSEENTESQYCQEETCPLKIGEQTNTKRKQNG